MLPTRDHEAKFIGRVGDEISEDEGRAAAQLAALNGLAVVKQKLGSLADVTWIGRLGVLIAAAPDFCNHAKVADAASELLRDVFGEERNPWRMVYGVASLPLGVPLELELIFELVA